MNILWAVIWFVAFGGLFGLLLAYASKVFKADIDERINQINELLPGVNCGGCGYAGCNSLAESIVKGKASPAACTAVPVETAVKISAVMGMDAVTPVRMRAHVMCSGTFEYAKNKYTYVGPPDCVSVTIAGGGDKLCPNGCLGHGTCVSKCKFDAIKVINGVAVIDYIKCTGCGTCVAACPKHIIKLVPFENEHWVGCMSINSAAETRKNCTVGCIGCKLCEKACESDAIHVQNNLASINYDKCIDCGKCVDACPRHVIWSSKKQTSVGAVIPKEALKTDV